MNTTEAKMSKVETESRTTKINQSKQQRKKMPPALQDNHKGSKFVFSPRKKGERKWRS